MSERVLWPRGRRTVTARPVAPRLDTLAGKTVAQLWDDLFRGDEIFPMLESALAQRFPGVKFVGYRTFGSTHGAEEHGVAKDDQVRKQDTAKAGGNVIAAAVEERQAKKGDAADHILRQHPRWAFQSIEGDADEHQE